MEDSLEESMEKPRPAVDVRDFGAVADWNGDSGTDNHKAFQEAIKHAADTGHPVYVPAGKYYIDASTPLEVRKNLVLFGDGSESTFIKVGPLVQTDVINLLDLGNNLDLHLSGLRIEGPDTPKAGTSGPLYVCLCATGGSRLYLDNLHVRKFRNPFWMKEDTVGSALPKVHARRCDIESYETCMLVRAGVRDSELIVEDCDLAVQDSDPGTKIGDGAIIYIEQGVSLRCTNTRFHRTNKDGYGIHFWFGSTAPRYAIVANCWFSAAVDSKMISNSKQLTQVSNCAFLMGDGTNKGIEVQPGGIAMDNCLFLYSGKCTGSAIHDTNMTNGTGMAIITNCVFTGDAGLHATLHRTANPENPEAAAWRMHGCTFSGAGMKVYESETAKRAHASFVDCYFNPGWGGPRLKGGAYEFRGCIFEQRDIDVHGGEGDVELHLQDNIFRGTALGPTVAATMDHALSMFGHSNRFSGKGYFIFTNPKAKGYLCPVSNLGPTVASAPTVFISPDADMVHITGEATIDNLEIGKSATLKCTAAFRGPFRLIADGSWKTSMDGNIRSTNIGARVPGECYSFVYSADDGFWYEIS